MLAPCVTAECCSRVSEYLRTFQPLDNTCFVNARVTSTQFFSSFISKFAYILCIPPMNDNIVPLTHFTVRHIVSIWWESHVDAEKLINRCIVLKNIRNTHCMAVFSCSYKYKYKLSSSRFKTPALVVSSVSGASHNSRIRIRIMSNVVDKSEI